MRERNNTKFSVDLSPCSEKTPLVIGMVGGKRRPLEICQTKIWISRIKKILQKSEKVDFHSAYIGKVVKVIDTVTKTSGAITVFDERWEARLQNEGEEIPEGADVKIVGNDSLILFVEKV